MCGECELALHKFNAYDMNGASPLWLAAMIDSEPLVSLLLEKGALVDTANMDGKTPLTMAAGLDHTAAIKRLLRAGADPLHCNGNGQTPRDHAAQKNHVKVVALLEASMAEMRAKAAPATSPQPHPTPAPPVPAPVPAPAASPICNISLPRKVHPSAAEFHATYRNKRPLLFSCTDAATGWMKPGSMLESLSAEQLDAPVSVLRSRNNRQFLKHGLTSTALEPLAEAIGRILLPDQGSEAQRGKLAGPGGEMPLCYVRMYLDAAPAAWAASTQPLLAQLEALSQADSSFKLANVGVWLSSAGCETPLHFDLCHGFLHQAVGSKTFILAAPADTPYLYWDRHGGTASSDKNRTTSPVDLLRWLAGDAEQRRAYPHVDNCAFFEARLGPGDTLYTPPGWWHAVVSETASVSVLAPFDPCTDEEELPFNVLLV